METSATLEHPLERATLDRIAVPVWAWLVAAFALVGVYAMTMENGATLAAGATFLHELFHDGRHMLGVPCH